MSSFTRKDATAVRRIGGLGILAGGALIGTGVTVWRTVSRQLADQKITVAPDARYLANEPVHGPLTAYAQAAIINTHSLKISGGKTFAELPQDDPTREVIMNASFLRASLFTSVVSFGVAAFAIGSGAVTSLTGVALRRIGRH